jgi:hypothetical protein
MNELLDQLIFVAGQHAELIMTKLHMPLMPTWVYLTQEGATIAGTPWADEVEKKVMAMELRKNMLAEGAKAYSLVTEVWASAAPKGWNPETDDPIRASEQANRQEYVLCFATDGDETQWKRWAIKRNHLEIVTALEAEDWNPGDKAHSWLTKLLRK